VVSRSLSAVVRVFLSLAAVAAITTGYVWLSANPTTVALTYLLAIVLVANWSGIGVATIASVAAMLCFNIFFLPPVGTLTIADPQNWVSFFAFMAVAVLVSQLSGRARDRQLEALARQQDLERLYALSRALLLADGDVSLIGEMARRLAETFSLTAVALYDRPSDRIAWGGAAERLDIDTRLREVARTAEVIREPSGLVITPIRLGGAPIGSLAIAGGALGDAVLQSVANLAAIGLERARSHEAMAASEAARQSSELRAVLLDAVAHEFKTPLTAGKAAASALLSSATANPNDHDLVVIINEELERLQALVTDAIHMLRIDAGDMVVQRERQHVSDVVGQAIREMGSRLEGHRLTVDIAESLVVEADASLLRLAFRQLLDNAVKYSPTDSAIGVTAGANGDVRIAVGNSGPPISSVDRARIFDRFYRGRHSENIPGSGLGLAIVRRIALAHDGDVAVTSDASIGTVFTLILPRPHDADAPALIAGRLGEVSP
jgi:two-component system sensor histidine kinase KdpD